MLLAVDVGNTNTVLGLFTGEELVRSWRITTHARATGDEMALTFRGLLDEQPEITGLVLCSTVPSVLHELRPMLSSFFHEIPVVIVEPGTKTGVPILTDNPKGSRCRSHRQHARRPSAVRWAVHRRGFRYVHQP